MEKRLVMDDRKLQLKQLRKIANKQKRKYVTAWKVLTIIFLLAAMGLVAEHVFVKFLPCYAIHGAAAALALSLIALILWGVGKKKWKKTIEYLDYRTMKNTLRQEKKFQ